MTQDSCETIPVRVPRLLGAKQAGEVRVRRAWSQRTVWTDRMLTALERGVKGVYGQGLSLAERLLCRAWAFQHGSSPCPTASIRGAVNHRLESRVREIRLHGSEGGETGQPVFPTPIMANTPGGECATW